MSHRLHVAAARLSRAAARFALTLLGGSACAADSATAPAIAGQGITDQYSSLAFTVTVDTRSNRITLTPPTAATAAAPTLAIAGIAGPDLSLLGSDAVRMLTTNYRESAVGAFAPNKVRVSFDVVIENRLPGIRLVSPTWPLPPARGVILFPLDYVVTVAPGGVAGSDGNSVVVTQPRFGNVTPSIDFNGTGDAGSGAPYSFFNDAECAQASTSDCFRWEAFESEIKPLGRSGARTVGFDIDASVAQFRARMIVAADLAPAAVTARLSGTASTATTRQP